MTKRDDWQALVEQARMAPTPLIDPSRVLTAVRAKAAEEAKWAAAMSSFLARPQTLWGGALAMTALVALASVQVTEWRLALSWAELMAGPLGGGR